jgi:hypothetical protein
MGMMSRCVEQIRYARLANRPQGIILLQFLRPFLQFTSRYNKSSTVNRAAHQHVELVFATPDFHLCYILSCSGSSARRRPGVFLFYYLFESRDKTEASSQRDMCLKSKQTKGNRDHSFLHAPHVRYAQVIGGRRTPYRKRERKAHK